MHRKRLNTIINSVIQIDNLEIDDVTPELIEDYKKLNEKCDSIISKIKNRKNQQEKK